MQESPLGQKTTYVTQYDASLLFPVERSMARSKTGITSPLPFMGVDLWTAYELSWLNRNGKPQVAMATLTFPCSSHFLVESKSLKLYFNSFTQTQYETWQEVHDTIQRDLSIAAQAPVLVDLYPLAQQHHKPLEKLYGTNIDEQDITFDCYDIEPSFLSAKGPYVEETLTSDLLKSNCLATGQPDWGSVQIHYTGPQIDHAGLLRYIVSFRNHSGFAEHCVEQFFSDIMQRCQPEKLSVYCRYTRRGGIDINPFRSNFEKAPANKQHVRQ